MPQDRSPGEPNLNHALHVYAYILVECRQSFDDYFAAIAAPFITDADFAEFMSDAFAVNGQRRPAAVGSVLPKIRQLLLDKLTQKSSKLFNERFVWLSQKVDRFTHLVLGQCCP